MAYCYRTYTEAFRDIREWLPHVPPISAVAGVPRSGIIVAGMIAQLREIPLLPIESLMNDVRVFRPECSRTLRATAGKVLIVDDTCHSGRTNALVRNALRDPESVLWGAVYASQHVLDHRLLDVAGYRINTPWHAFEWNLMRDATTPHMVLDFDGVLCPDWHQPADDGEFQAEYERWLETVPPLHLPDRPVRAIVTARLEKYRAPTAAWLARHGVKYEQLLMHPGSDPRRRNSVAFKSAQYERLAGNSNVFVESCPRQAAAIASITGRAVLCFASGELHNPTPMTPLFR